MMNPMKTQADRSVALFGTSRSIPDDEDWKTARHLGRHIAEHGWTLVCGGYGGVMEAASLGVTERGGRAVGVLVEPFGVDGNPHLSEKFITPDLFTRVRTIIEKSDAYIVMPGSTGTLVELALVWELLNKGIVRDRPLLCLGEYWRPVVNHLAAEPLKDPRLRVQPGPRFAGEQIVFCETAEDAVHQLVRTWH